MRWVWNTSCTTCALAASAASTSPRAYAERDSTLPSSSHTASSSSSSAATGSVSGRSTSVLDLDELGRRDGPSARSSATTNASTSPRYDVRPPSGMKTGQSLWMSPTRSSPGTSAAVNTRTTPGTRPRRVGVDAQHVGAGVVGEPHRAVQHAGRRAGRRRTACRRARARSPGSELPLDADAAERRAASRGLALARAARPRRGSSRSRCSGTGARRGGARRSSRSRSAPLLVEQRRDPHEDARACRTRTAARRVAANADAKRSRSSSSAGLRAW